MQHFLLHTNELVQHSQICYGDFVWVNLWPTTAHWSCLECLYDAITNAVGFLHSSSVIALLLPAFCMFFYIPVCQKCLHMYLQDVNMDGLMPSLDCCKAINVSTDSSISVVPYTPPSKSAPPDSVSSIEHCDVMNFPNLYVIWMIESECRLVDKISIVYEWKSFGCLFFFCFCCQMLASVSHIFHAWANKQGSARC